MSRGHGEWDILQTREQGSRPVPLVAYPECPSPPSISPLNPSSRPWAPKPSPADDTANCDNETRLRVLRRANHACLKVRQELMQSLFSGSGITGRVRETHCRRNREVG